MVKKIRRQDEGERATTSRKDQRKPPTSRAVPRTSRASSVRTRTGGSPRRKLPVPVPLGPDANKGKPEKKS